MKEKEKYSRRGFETPRSTKRFFFEKEFFGGADMVIDWVISI